MSRDQEFFRSDQVAGQMPTAALTISESWRSGPWTTRVQATGLQSFTESVFYPNIREIFAGRESTTIQAGFGRKTAEWSRGEDLWRRGLWQPQFEWDKLWPESQGLTGFHWRQRMSDSGWRFQVFASPFFAPGLGPVFRVDDGAVVSGNPWFRPPVSNLEFLSVNTEIRYDLQIPNIDRILLNPGGAAKVEWRQARFAAAFGYAYKPMNTLRILAPYALRADSGSGAPPPVTVSIRPRVEYHHLLTAEVANEGPRPRWLSVTAEVPDLKAAPAAWLDQNMRPAWVIDAYQGWRWPDQSAKASEIFLAFSQLWGGDEPSTNEMVRGTLVFERRYRFQQAARAGFKNYFFTFRKRPVTGLLEATYDFAQRGAIFSAEARYEIRSGFGVFARADAMGLVGSGPARVANGFIAEYRANDRLQAGLTYAF